MSNLVLDFRPFQPQISRMANLATKAPNFTHENAAAMSKLAHAAIRARKEREKAALANARPKPEDARRETTLRQIDRLDDLINKALDAADEERFLKLSAAKERLWRLVQPTAGSLRPGRGSRRSEAPPDPQPIRTPQAPPPPANPPAQ